MVAITLSAPVVARAPVALAKRTRVTARAAMGVSARAAGTVSLGANRMMTGSRVVEASRVVAPTAAGRKSLVWCAPRRDAAVKIITPHRNNISDTAR
jgi:hypothetical protein